MNDIIHYFYFIVNHLIALLLFGHFFSVLCDFTMTFHTIKRKTCITFSYCRSLAISSILASYFFDTTFRQCILTWFSRTKKMESFLWYCDTGFCCAGIRPYKWPNFVNKTMLNLDVHLSHVVIVKDKKQTELMRDKSKFLNSVVDSDRDSLRCHFIPCIIEFLSLDSYIPVSETIGPRSFMAFYNLFDSHW